LENHCFSYVLLEFPGCLSGRNFELLNRKSCVVANLLLGQVMHESLVCIMNVLLQRNKQAVINILATYISSALHMLSHI